MLTPQHLSLLTVEQVAEFLQCSTDQVERFIRIGELRRVSLSIREVGKGPRGRKCWRIRPAALEEFIAGREGYEPQPPKKPTPLPASPLPKYRNGQILGPDGKYHPCGPDGKKRLKLW